MNEQKINKCGCGGEPKYHGHDNFWLRCESCNTETDTFPTKEQALEAWNRAHPEISNAEKTYNWIRCGKNITHYEQSDFYYLWCQEKGLVLERNKNEKYKKGEGTPVCGSLLFERHWKLYQEQKYREVSGKQALIEWIQSDYQLRVGIPLGKGVYYLYWNADPCSAWLFLKTDDGDKLHITQSILDGIDWRIYD